MVRWRQTTRYLVALVFAAQWAVAEERDIDTGILELGLGGGSYWTDSGRNLEASASFGATMGLHPTPRWAFLLSYQTFESDDTRPQGETDVEVKKYHVDAHYYFRPDQPLRPYLVGGLGEIEVIGQRRKPSGSRIRDKETLLIGGAGLSYTLSPRWAVRSELSHAYSLDERHGDNTLQFIVAYRFVPRD